LCDAQTRGNGFFIGEAMHGMTETSPVSFQSLVEDPVDLRVATVGRVQPHLEVKIVDA
jgi:fatty-acyl-CoA synthase